MLYVLKLVDWLEKAVRYVVGEVEQHELSKLEDRVYGLIAESGDEGLLHSHLSHRLRRNSGDEIQEAIASLVNSELIVVQEVNKEGPGRTGKRYFAHDA